MDDLNVWLKAQALITRRVGMAAENSQRFLRGEYIAYSDTAFNELADEFEALIPNLKESSDASQKSKEAVV